MVESAQEKIEDDLDDLDDLDDDQRGVLDRVLAGHNVFFTGSAGTGKTHLLTRIVRALQARHGDAFRKVVAVTAMTGIAATHVGGVTLNSALGLQVPAKYADFSTMQRKQHATRIRAWKVLIIDECSMLSAELLQMVEHMLRRVRRSCKPGGGLQFVVCGDFYQLPCIESALLRGHDPVPPDAFTNYGYAFEAPAWRAIFPPEAHVVLRHIFRQDDADFARALNNVRRGDEAAATSLRWIAESCSEPVVCSGGIKPTRIFSRNVDVDALNARELGTLPGEAPEFTAVDTVSSEIPEVANSTANANFFRQCLVPASIRLKTGAQVMLLKNLDAAAGLVNGSRGIIVRFVPKLAALATLAGTKANAETMHATQRWPGRELPVARFMNGRDIIVFPAVFSQAIANGRGECRRLQLPLKLAWTVTIHKSQGMTLDAAEVSLAGVFAPGQAYVALSRAKNMQGLQVTGWDGRVLPADSRVHKFYATLEKSSGDLEKSSGDLEKSSGEREDLEDFSGDKTWRAFCERRFGVDPAPPGIVPWFS
jgi:ATP-dependent DNA helicase PIF1